MKNRSIDLESKYLCMIKDILKVHLGESGIKVYIFGSRVQGRTKETSDIDLALKSTDGSKLDYFDVMCKLKDVFMESDIRYSVDILDLNNISDDFRKCISDDLVEVKY
ncbi:MAG: nucleotidyltransferase domain-containing protein [Endomicrobium sp.]|jgi:predicted nucleotidyltransferase|nr:nucleotidyltransferase domain-containing protein [Endomicrobium sp.]